MMTMLAAWFVVSAAVGAFWVAAVYVGEVVHRRRFDRRFLKACRATWPPLDDDSKRNHPSNRGQA